MFSGMIASIENEAVEAVFKLEAKGTEKLSGAFSSVSKEFLHPNAVQLKDQGNLKENSSSAGDETGHPINPTVRLSHPKVGRNDLCPCGSGKKYKKCCGR